MVRQRKTLSESTLGRRCITPMWEIFMSGMCKCRNVVKVCQLLRATVRKNQAKSWFRGKSSKIDFFHLAFSSRSAKRSEFIISSRAKQKRAQCLDRACILASCKLAAFIFTYVYPMVSAMTSYSSLTSRRIFCFLATYEWKRFPINDQSIHEELACLFIVCETMFTIGESQAISHANGTEQQ